MAIKKLVALTGFSPVDIPIGWNDDTTEGYVLIIDNKQYIAFRDPSDGFRSYGIFIEDDGNYECKYKFPPQMVWLEEYSDVDRTDDDYPTCTDGIRITNNNDELVLEISTTHYDEYYPVGMMEYHPENLPINKSKTEDFNNKSVEIIAEWFRENGDHVVIGKTDNEKYIEGLITKDGLVFGEITNFNTKQ